MNRRETLLLLLALGIAPHVVRAQTSAKPARVGMLLGASPESTPHLIAAAKQRLRELGHVEGKNLVFDVRSAMGDAARITGLARELVASKPEVILVSSLIATRAVQQATSTIPIVVAGGDVAGTGLVKNLARPEGNITGVSHLLTETSSKLLELALAVNPKGAPIAVLGNPTGPLFATALKELQSGAMNAGVGLLVVNAQTAADIDQAFAQMARERARTVVVVSDSFFMQRRKQIAEEAIRFRVASFVARREYVEAGGLMSYGSDLAEGLRLAANYVDRILKGAKPADLPVQQPTKFELVVNLKTAKAIGVKVPREVLMRADVTIE